MSEIIQDLVKQEWLDIRSRLIEKKPDILPSYCYIHVVSDMDLAEEMHNNDGNIDYEQALHYFLNHYRDLAANSRDNNLYKTVLDIFEPLRKRYLEAEAVR